MATSKATNTRIDDLKDYLGKRLDGLAMGQQKMFDLYEDHIKDDKEAFEGLRTAIVTHKTEIADSFKKLEVKAAEDTGKATVTAKLWGLGGSGVVAALTAAWEYAKHYYGVK